MNPKSIIIVIVILAILGLAIAGYLKAVPGVENQTDSRPQIEISPNSFDFGEIKYGQISEYIFMVRNSGNEILEIKKVATSCACTKGSISKDKIAPGEEIELKVSYDTGAMSGPHGMGKQERIIYIKSNDPINPQIEVTIHAYVK